MREATIRQAAILVGGLGTRLGALTSAIPKPLLPSGDRPFLGWLIRELSRFGVDEVLLLTGHLGSVVEAAVPGIAASLAKPVRIHCVHEPSPAGTGGALFNARDRLADRFLLLNGDSWLDFNLARLLADAALDPAHVLGRMVVRHLQDASRYGVVELHSDEITGFRERPDPGQPGTINAGIYLFDRRVLEMIAPVCSLERDVLPRLAVGGALRGTIGQGYFIDIGVPADLATARTELPARMQRRALFLDRDGVININHGWVGTQDRFEFIPGALDTLREASDRGWHVFVVTNQSGIARGLYDEAQFGRLSRWMTDQVRAAGGTIDDLRYCPMHPQATVRAHRGQSDWRKPAPGMLLDLLRAWSLEARHCLMVGDSETDMQAAAAAGMAGHLFTGGNLLDFVRPLFTA